MCRRLSILFCGFLSSFNFQFHVRCCCVLSSLSSLTTIKHIIYHHQNSNSELAFLRETERERVRQGLVPCTYKCSPWSQLRRISWYESRFVFCLCLFLSSTREYCECLRLSCVCQEFLYFFLLFFDVSGGFLYAIVSDWGEFKMIFNEKREWKWDLEGF